MTRTASPVGQRSLERTLAGAVFAGALVGFVIAGVGGRVAMRVLALTSDPSLTGMLTDDGFVVGEVTLTGTLQFLLLEGVPAGIFAAFVYLAVRPVLPRPLAIRSVCCGLLAAAVFGPLLVHVDGVDFRALEPTWLAIGSFVALPGLLGLCVPPAVERATRSDGWFATASRPRALAPLILVAYPPLLVALGVPGVVVVAARSAAMRRPGVWRVVRAPAVLWTARGMLAALAVIGAAALARDVAVIL